MPPIFLPPTFMSILVLWSLSPISSAYICTGVNPSTVVTALKKELLLQRQSTVDNSSSAGGGVCGPFSHLFWHVDWLDLMQILYKSPQLPWTHGSSSDVISRKQNFIAFLQIQRLLPSFQFSFTHYFLSLGEAGRGRIWYMSYLEMSTHLSSAFCSVCLHWYSLIAELI